MDFIQPFCLNKNSFPFLKISSFIIKKSYAHQSLEKTIMWIITNLLNCLFLSRTTFSFLFESWRTLWRSVFCIPSSKLTFFTIFGLQSREKLFANTSYSLDITAILFDLLIHSSKTCKCNSLGTRSKISGHRGYGSLFLCFFRISRI